MKCPFCGKDMVVGSIDDTRGAVKWYPADKDMGPFNFTPLVKGIKLTSMVDPNLKVFYCEPCRKFVIDQDDSRL